MWITGLVLVGTVAVVVLANRAYERRDARRFAARVEEVGLEPVVAVEWCACADCSRLRDVAQEGYLSAEVEAALPEIAVCDDTPAARYAQALANLEAMKVAPPVPEMPVAETPDVPKQTRRRSTRPVKKPAPGGKGAAPKPKGRAKKAKTKTPSKRRAS